MGCSKFLQGLYVPELRHRTLSSPLGIGAAESALNRLKRPLVPIRIVRTSLVGMMLRRFTRPWGQVIHTAWMAIKMG